MKNSFLGYCWEEMESDVVDFVAVELTIISQSGRKMCLCFR